MIARRVAARLRETAARRALELQWTLRETGRPHVLARSVIVSLTSHPPRFATLHLALMGLLSQSVRPDRVHLWIAEADMDALPDAVRALTRSGLAIAPCAQTGPYKKLLPTLRGNPRAVIVTADDDAYYGRAWLAGLLDAHRADPHTILAYRAHRLRCDKEGRPLPYRQWDAEIAAGPPCPRTMATGVGGVLYPPDALHRDVADDALARRLCPTTDDIWFYLMARRQGTLARKVGRRANPHLWLGTQSQALTAANVTGTGNDRQLAAALDHFRLAIAP